MKKVLVSVFVFFVLLILAAGFTSCSKSAPTPMTKPSLASTPAIELGMASMEYRITALSSNVTVVYTMTDASGNTVETEKWISRMNETIFADLKSGNIASIKAWNSDGQREDITLEIYANGEFVASGSLNFNTGYAEASGTVY